MLFQFFDVLLGDVLPNEKGQNHIGEEFHFAPEPHHPPGPEQGDTDFAVCQDHFRPGFCRPADRPEHVLSGIDVKAFRNLLLKGHHQQL